jgi:hypothetical protein
VNETVESEGNRFFEFDDTLERFPLGLNREDSQRLVNERVYPP